MRKLNKIILHCSDSDIKGHDNIEVIKRWHVEERGWKDVGYHFFIQSNGNIQAGRPVSHIGSHTIGENLNSIGICLHGRHNFTQLQFDSLRRLVNVLRGEYGALTIHGHCEFAPKTCPNFDYKKLFEIGDLDPKTEKRV
jgi:N-acetylmuramoyl-L-alanine amidase